MSKSKNDVAWEKIFEKYKILEQISRDGYMQISSTEINEFREARLMTKFDHKSQLPKLFQENRLAILPNSRGGYVIGNFETFCVFNDDNIEVTKINFPTFLESIDYNNISSESTAINCAFVSKILHDFIGEENLFPTVSGRMSSLLFNFNIESPHGLFNIDVENSQIEIDGGYEGDNSLSLIEAKNYISDDFLVRQLYYPYKLWSNKITKKVRPIYLTYSNGTFHLREYTFTDINCYNSLRLVNHKKYSIQDGEFNIEIIQEILESTRIVEEQQLPFPQANNFDRIINLCELLNQRGFILKDDITLNYDFDSRQTDYYANACRYLGLVQIGSEGGSIGCYLTKEGERLFNMNILDRQKEFVRLILSHYSFNQTLKLYFENGEMPNNERIVEVMMNAQLHNVKSRQTYKRRASTIISWINWIINQIDE
ncbi:MAG: hypothetical protein H6Q16_1389 [Bacteroidetes bacterium]|nr:hypothetical protein [Bacteroidota bacterium]